MSAVISSIPAGVWYGAEGVVTFTVLAALIIFIRGVKVKKSKDGDIEIETDGADDEKK